MKQKNKYLYQLMITGAILILVPSIFFLVFFLERSTDEIRIRNEKYYKDMCRTFSGTFVEEISNFKTLAVRFGEKSRDVQNRDSILYEGSGKMSGNPYYYWEAAKEVADYGLNTGNRNFGVYYYETDIILYDGNKYSVKQMISYHLEEDDELTDFFQEDNYTNSRVLLAPVYDRNGEFQKVLLGVCTRLGKEREKVLCFKGMEPEDMAFFWQSSQGRSWEKYYVMDTAKESLVYGISSEPIRRGEVTFSGAGQSQAGEEDSMLYSISSSRYGLTFILDISGDKEQSNVLLFYNRMRNYMLYVMLLMVLLACLAVWLNYRPVRMMLKLVESDGKNEFDSFFNSWERQNLKLTEQRAMIMDLLLNYLLYGLPLSEKHMEELGVTEGIRKYCVFILDQYVLLSAEIADITQFLEQKFKCIMFVTDLVGDNSTIIMTFMEKDQTKEIREWLEAWCKEHISSEWSLHCGAVVDELSQMQISLKECKRQMNRKKEEVLEVGNIRKEEEHYEILKEDILAYLDKNYTDPELTQTVVADHFRVSVYTMSRLLKKQFDIGFVDYINGKRLELAKQLLKTTEIPVREIAIEVGFSDANYFSRIFKKYTGVSPSKYRED